MSSTAQQSFVAVDDSFSNVTPSVIHFVFTLVAQTFVFGVYTLLLCLSTRLLLKRGLEIRANRVMLSLTLFMYILSIGYWAFFIVYAVDLLRAHINVAAKPLSDHDEITRWLPLVNSIAMIIFVLSDGVLIWRAWAIGQRQLRKYLWFSMGFLGLAAVAVVLAISFRMASFFKSNVFILFSWVFSLVSSLSATGLVAVPAWRHHQILNKTFTDKGNFANESGRDLALDMKIGLFYCFATFLALIFSFIPLPHGTLGDVYYPLSVHIASAYPSVVILLVDMNPSFVLSETTTFSNGPISGRSDLSRSVLLGFRSADVIQTTTVGGLGPTTSITGPDIIHPLHKTMSSMSTPKRSRFSDNSLDPRRVV